MNVAVCQCCVDGGKEGSKEGSKQGSKQGVLSALEPQTADKRKIGLVALSTESSGGHALFMTLNVNINVENSIKNIYLLISQMFRTCYCRMILVFLSFLFLPDDSGSIWSQHAKIHLLPPCGRVGFSPRTPAFAFFARIKASL